MRKMVFVVAGMLVGWIAFSILSGVLVGFGVYHLGGDPSTERTLVGLTALAGVIVGGVVAARFAERERNSAVAPGNTRPDHPRAPHLAAGAETSEHPDKRPTTAPFSRSVPGARNSGLLVTAVAIGAVVVAFAVHIAGADSNDDGSKPQAPTSGVDADCRRAVKTFTQTAREVIHDARRYGDWRSDLDSELLGAHESVEVNCPTRVVRPGSYALLSLARAQEGMGACAAGPSPCFRKNVGQHLHSTRAELDKMRARVSTEDG